MHFCRLSQRCEDVPGISRLVVYLFQRCEDVPGISRLVVYLFHRYITFYKECKLYSG